jgi:DNA polymerase-1
MNVRLAIDTETDVHEDQSVPDLVCVSYATETANGLLDRAEGLDFARAVLHDPEIELVTHNGPFDYAVLCKQDPALYPAVFEAYDTGRCYDTMAAAMVDDIARGCYFGTRKGRYGLGDLSDALLNLPMVKGDDTYRLRYGELKGVPVDQWPEEARSYALLDPVRTLAVANAIHEPVDARRQGAHFWWLHLMSAHGIMTDAPRVQALLSQTVAEAAALCEELIPLGLVEVTKDGLKKREKNVRERVERALGENAPRTDPSRTHPRGQIQISAEVCEATGPDGLPLDPALAKFARLNALLDVINKDADYLSRDIVRCRYGLAETGRSTCFAPNLQNLKKVGGIRECFIPRPGYVFAIADYSGLELCTLAQVCTELIGYSKLGEAINAGLDAHCIVAARLLHCSYEEAVRRYKAGDPVAINARQTGKVANFGMPGGLGPSKLVIYAWAQYGVRITIQEAKQLKALWLTLYPEFREYFALVNSLPDPVEQLYSGRLRGGALFTEKANSLFQGLGGDGTKAAGFLLSRRCYAVPESVLYGCRPVNYEHDAFMVEVPEEGAHDCAVALEQTMVEGAAQFIPGFLLKAEPILTRRWSKKAKEVRDSNGRLVPWEIAA